jgi:hypothetical protein
MDIPWDTLLLISKFAFLGLIYLVLLVVVLAVHREMRQNAERGGHATASAPGRLKIVESGSDPLLRPGRVLALQSQSRIGADADNDIVLDDKFVWLIEDLGSTNGTFVDGRRCAPHQEEMVLIGAILEIGDVVLQLLG